MSSQERIVVKATELDVSKITFETPRQVKNVPGAETVPILYDGKKLYVQTPEMRIPFTVSYFDPNKTKGGNKGSDDDPDKKPETTGNEKWNLNLALDDEENNEEMSTLRQKLEELEEAIVTAAFENNWRLDKRNKNKALRNKSVPKTVLENDLSSILKDSDKKDDKGNPMYPATMTVKVPYYKGQFTTECYDEQRELITDRTVDQILTGGSRAVCLLNFNQVFLGQKISYKPSLLQAKVKASGQRIAGYGFIDDMDPAENDEESSEVPASKKNQKKREILEVEESEEEEEEEAEEEEDTEDDEEEAQPVSIKKKKGRARN